MNFRKNDIIILFLTISIFLFTGCSVKDNPSTGEFPPSNTSSEEIFPDDSLLSQDNMETITPESSTNEPEEKETYPDAEYPDTQQAFYHEPLSEDLIAYITGVSFPTGDNVQISYNDLSCVHVLYYNFDGEIAEGQLISNKYIAQDLVDIFYELYYNEYPIEKIQLIDVYGGNDDASMEDNNTSCFNYRNVPNSSSLSKHSLGLAIDVNPLYNPYITYNKDGTENISPASASSYADRSTDFPHKIDKDDLCYRLFTEHGFTWGGDWKSCKDYQHFQKDLP